MSGWRWIAVRSRRAQPVPPLVAGETRNSDPGDGMRFDIACGQPDTDATVTEPSGEVRCLACLRRVVRTV